MEKTARLSWHKLAARMFLTIGAVNICLWCQTSVHDSVYLAASGTMLGRPYMFGGCSLGPTLCSDPASYGGLYRSIDSGKSWIKRGPTGITALTSNGNNLFAAGRVFYHSLNYGQNWNPLKISHGKVGSISIDEIPVNTVEMSWLGGKLYVSSP